MLIKLMLIKFHVGRDKVTVCSDRDMLGYKCQVHDDFMRKWCVNNLVTIVSCYNYPHFDFNLLNLKL